jgi:hypothetical protein
MVPFTKVVFKTFPNKWKKKPTHPDVKGTVECETPDGSVVVYDYAQWKPQQGKSQTMTVWKLKQDTKEDTGQADAPAEQTAEQPRTEEKPPPRSAPRAPEVKDDAQDW